MATPKTPATKAIVRTVPPQVAKILANNAAEGRRLERRGRVAALGSIALFLPFIVPWPSVLYYHGLLAVFVASGLLQSYLLDRPNVPRWTEFGFATFDMSLMVFTLLYPNPMSLNALQPQLLLRFGNDAYLFVLIVGAAFSFRPLLVLWAGFVAAVGWAVAVALIYRLPGSYVRYPGEGTDAFVAALTDPFFINFDAALQTIVVILIVAGLLAMVVDRARRIVAQMEAATRERENLARYFPPATVERLARQDGLAERIREQPAAVLFADLVGFTKWAEARSPAEVIGFLRDVHALLERAVFAHEGTVDKFTGDGMLATFGTPEPASDDAARAVECVAAILAEDAEWRRTEGLTEMPALSLGLHYGPIVVGDVGTERRMELAVLGDTVNVASRLERLTRELGVAACFSEAVVDAAGGVPNASPAGPITLRGRATPIPVWTFANQT